MNIGFDAKRAYHNSTGLGNFSRTLIGLLSDNHPEHNYFLFNPKPSKDYIIHGATVREILPRGFVNRLFSSAWRSSWVKKDLRKLGIDIYHGVSHEIPIGIQKTGIKSVVTIHDLIHERHPEQYNPIDVQIYSKKFRYACKHADKIMAISQQTKKDIIDFYDIPAEKIVVCYQSCNPLFAIDVSEEEKQKVKKKYDLPEKFYLYVGAITERKNLLNICKAFTLVRKEVDIPLVIAGDGGKYKQRVKDFIKENSLEDRIIFLYEKKELAGNKTIPLNDMPAIYQSAIAMVYPSYFEGFGAPVLEALWSKLPVITSNVSALPEVGGPGSYYVNPDSPEEIAKALTIIYTDRFLGKIMKDAGSKHVLKFSPQQYVESVMELYKSLC
jgi:glycosyltransferase involved in cell wall biosynthesis